MESVAQISRANTIGATDIAKIIGISPWGDAWSVYAEKKGLLEREPETERMHWGKVLQQPIAKEWCEQHGELCQWWDQQLLHSKEKWMSATPDAFLVRDDVDREALSWWARRKAVLEIKTVGFDQFPHWDRESAFGVPDYYQAQGVWQMAVTELPRCHVAALFAGNSLGSFVIERDPEIEMFMLDEGYEFWRKHLMADVPPPIGGSEAARQYLQKKWPRERLKMRRPEPDERLVIDEYSALRREQSRLKSRRDTLENMLKEALKEHAGFEWESGKFTWKASQRKKTDWKKLAYRQMEGFSQEEIKAFIEEFTENNVGRRIYFKDAFTEEEDSDNGRD